MRTGVTIIVVLVVAVAAAGGGYWLGFREAWSMGVRADAVPKGAVALGELHLLERGSLDELRSLLESDIDNSLVLWRDLSASPLRSLINPLSGADVFPEYELYVRKLAAYRKNHKSPLSNPAAVRELGPSAESSSRAIDETVKKYAQ